MQTTKVINVNIVGEQTGRSYSGQFTVKMVMTDRDDFTADLRRRQIIGPSPEGTPPAAALQWKAFVLGQIYAKCIETPAFWRDSGDGMDLEDKNVALEIYNEILEEEDKFQKEIKKNSEKALEKLKGKTKKDTEEASEE